MTVFTSSTCTADPLTEKALAELRSILKTETEFVKVHAAEYLIWLGYPDEVRQEFLKENELHGDQPKYRITIWRVLAQTETDPRGKQVWYDKIFKAFGDVNGPDRLHAAETLAKLKLSPAARYPEATQKSINDESRNMQAYTHWALSYAPGANADQFRRDFLQMAERDTNQVVRMISAFILRKSGGLTEGEWMELAKTATAEPAASPLRKNLLNTAIVTFPPGAKKTTDYTTIRKAITENYQSFSAGERMELAQALAEKGEASDLPILASYLNNENNKGRYEANSKEAADVRANAAYAIIKISRRTEASGK